MVKIHIELTNKNRLYSPGDRVKGMITIVNKKDITASSLVVGCEGYAKIGWNDTHRVIRRDGEHVATYNTKYSNEVKYFHDQLTLWKSDRKKLEGGNHIFMISFRLPPKCPPSINGKHGCVEYSVYVKLHRPELEPKVVRLSFNVTNSLNLPSIPVSILPQELTLYTQIGRRRGMVDTYFSIPKRGYIPGESVKISMIIDNKSEKEIGMMKMELVRETMFYGKLDISGMSEALMKEEPPIKSFITESKLIMENKRTMCILPNHYEHAIVPFRIPILPKNEYLHPSYENNSLMSIRYSIVITLSVGSNDKIVEKMPIIIGTKPTKWSVDVSGCESKGIVIQPPTYEEVMRLRLKSPTGKGNL